MLVLVTGPTGMLLMCRSVLSLKPSGSIILEMGKRVQAVFTCGLLSSQGWNWTEIKLDATQIQNEDSE